MPAANPAYDQQVAQTLQSLQVVDDATLVGLTRLGPEILSHDRGGAGGRIRRCGDLGVHARGGG